MSDEEKQAIEYLKIEYEKLMKEDNILFPLYKSDAKRLIDIIEKQQKEIEELKEDRKSYTEEYIHNNPWLYKQLDENYILRTEADKLYNKKWEDKIKAKIEEIEKDKYISNSDFIEFAEYARDYAKKKVQSLLEKE